MKKEDKELLLRDLCARLPYGVQAQVDRHVNPLQILGISKLHKSTWAWKKGTYIVFFWNDTKAIENIKPYLRPMDSMTEEEKSELWWTTYCNDPKITEQSQRHIGWLLKNHFDFCDLIPKGLALPAPDGMYNKLRRKRNDI